ncbi:hypothetical protein, partial [Kibdelosporangium persicum]|uniref:hypothetical protein n=1 Tax=Kibdelosporangium persicum TaxID=2698649 RepID=UPI0039F12928
AAALAATGLIAYALYRQGVCARTFEGANAVGRARVSAPAELVAAGGFTSHPDEMIRESLSGRRGASPGGDSGCATEGSRRG